MLVTITGRWSVCVCVCVCVCERERECVIVSKPICYYGVRWKEETHYDVKIS